MKFSKNYYKLDNNLEENIFKAKARLKLTALLGSIFSKNVLSP